MASPFGPNLKPVQELLEEHGRPIHILDLARSGRMPTKSSTPQWSISRDLALSIRDDPNSPFVRVARGTYALAKWYDDEPEAA